LHKKDRPPLGLEQIQIFFKGVGGITDGIDDLVQYNVGPLVAIIHVVIPHFEKYPPLGLTQKYSDFRLFKSIAELVYNKEHLTEEGLNKVLSLKASLNKGLSLNLKQSFPPLGIIAIERPKVYEDSIINPY
jgi:LAGLIDADG endonuclease